MIDPREAAKKVANEYRDKVDQALSVLDTIDTCSHGKSSAEECGRRLVEKLAGIGLQSLGERRYFYKQHGMHNDIVFQRGDFILVVEGPIDSDLEKLKRLAAVLDTNLVRSLEKGLRTSSETRKDFSAPRKRPTET